MSELSLDELKEAIKVCEHYNACDFDLETNVLPTLLGMLEEKQKKELGELECRLKDLSSNCVLELMEVHSSSYEDDDYLNKVVSIVQRYLSFRMAYNAKIEQIQEDME